MAFLNPLWLLALPLIALPIVIHLLNQRRHRSIPWGAMQFLLTAKRMNRGMARLKQILIMAARMAAIAGLIFAVSRPLSSGWVGSITGGQPESIIVLLDRSASMQQQQTTTGESKLKSGLAKIVAALQTMGYQRPLVLIESGQPTPLVLERPADLLDHPRTGPTETSADIPAMLQAALDYVVQNQTGRTDIWLLSDAAINDWSPDSSRWRGLQSSFAQREGLRFQILQYPEPPTQNLAITVDQVRRQVAPDNANAAELVLDLTIKGRSSNDTVSLAFNINGLRSVLNLELRGETTSLVGHRIPIDQELASGWGSVQLPYDENESDNTAYFAFAPEPVRRTVIVTERAALTRAIQLAAETAPAPGVEHEVQVLSPEQTGLIDWQTTALLVWQGPLPESELARVMENFLTSGRSIVFLPPAEPSASQFAGWQWSDWSEINRQGQAVRYWNSDEDLLARTRNGQPLPVNDLKFYQYAKLQSAEAGAGETGAGETGAGETGAASTKDSEWPTTTLAQLENGATLLQRCKATGGTIYFLSTWPVGTHSSLDREGITLFVAIQRAMAQGIETVGNAKSLAVGSAPAQVVQELPQVLSAAADPWLGGRSQRAGVYGDSSLWVALNRPTAEDRGQSMGRGEIESLLAGLDFQIVEDQVGSGRSLASEVWRLFILTMGLALVAEAALCLPPKVAPAAKAVNEPRRAAA
jgi:hypothetical protein